jgi:hypothetical protein
VKKLVVISLFLTGLIILAGCTTNDSVQPNTSHQPLREEEEERNPVAGNPAEAHIVRHPPPVIQTTAPPHPKTESDLEKERVETNRAFCSGLVYCGDLSGGSVFDPQPNLDCKLADQFILDGDPKVIECFKIIHPGIGVAGRENWGIEIIKWRCTMGIGTTSYCARWGGTFIAQPGGGQRTG